MSGLDAVEIDFGDDKRFRIGTDEPAALASAIAQAKGETTVVPAALGDRP